MGSFYGWSILVAPLEQTLNATRTEISSIYSIAFISMTIGCFVTYKLLSVLSLPQLLFGIFSIGAAGLTISGTFETLWSKWIGYGVLFGFSIGVAYFVAMAAASLEMPIRRSIAISMTMAAFACGGLIWPPIFVSIINGVGLHTLIWLFAIYLFVVGLITALLTHKALPPLSTDTDKGETFFSNILTEQPNTFVLLWVGHLLIAFAALMALGHAAGIAISFGVSKEQAYIGPMLTNSVYICFALGSGIICDWITGRRVLIGIAALTSLALLALYFIPSATMSLIALALVGGAFGASSATFPITVSRYFGVNALARVYGRLASAYGLAGLLGPFAAGIFYDLNRSYNYSILIAALLAFLGVLTLSALPKHSILNTD